MMTILHLRLAALLALFGSVYTTEPAFQNTLERIIKSNVDFSAVANVINLLNNLHKVNILKVIEETGIYFIATHFLPPVNENNTQCLSDLRWTIKKGLHQSLNDNFLKSWPYMSKYHLFLYNLAKLPLVFPLLPLGGGRPSTNVKFSRFTTFRLGFILPLFHRTVDKIYSLHRFVVYTLKSVVRFRGR